MAIKTTVIKDPNQNRMMVMAADAETAQVVDALGYAARQYRQSLAILRTKANKALEVLDLGSVDSEFEGHPSDAYALVAVAAEHATLYARVDSARKMGVSPSTVSFILQSTEWFKVEIAPQGTATV